VIRFHPIPSIARLDHLSLRAARRLDLEREPVAFNILEKLGKQRMFCLSRIRLADSTSGLFLPSPNLSKLGSWQQQVGQLTALLDHNSFEGPADF